jgi:undecaprenyl-diphosphatase
MTCNLERAPAARFSFLISLPIMLAAGGLATLDLLQIQNLQQYLLTVAVGFLTAAIVGYLSIRWLLRFLTRHSLTGFAVYCVVLGLTVIVVSLL